ncbi:hypothetical protein HYS49_00575 [Candidatus Woesearchaeota archaeon]|nr:hypothetical protein [Candidatus Woesearchaeota archaeon]
MKLRYVPAALAAAFSAALACGDLDEPCSDSSLKSPACSLEQRCRSDGDCPGNEFCESGFCRDSSYGENGSPEEEFVRIDNATLRVESAAADGSVSFPDATIHLQDTEGNPLYNPQAAEVLSWEDYRDHRCFIVWHPAYAPSAVCPRIGASYKNASGAGDEVRISLTPAPLQVLSYDPHNDPDARLRSEESAAAFHLWGTRNGRYLGCREIDQVIIMMKGGGFILKIGSRLFSGGVAERAVDEVLAAMDSWATENLDDHYVADMYAFIPSEQGMHGTGTVWTPEIRRRREGERCDSSATPPGDPPDEPITACDELPSCIRFSAYDNNGSGYETCADPCIWTGTEQGTLARCVLPCTTNADCGSFGPWLLRCQPLSRFDGMEGNGCFLSACISNAECAPGEECIAIDDYPHQETASGAEPAAMMNTYDICYPVECLEE